MLISCVDSLEHCLSYFFNRSCMHVNPPTVGVSNAPGVFRHRRGASPSLKYCVNMLRCLIASRWGCVIRLTLTPHTTQYVPDSLYSSLINGIITFVRYVSASLIGLPLSSSLTVSNSLVFSAILARGGNMSPILRLTPRPASRSRLSTWQKSRPRPSKIVLSNSWSNSRMFSCNVMPRSCVMYGGRKHSATPATPNARRSVNTRLM